MSEKSRMRWLCRRGMKELDVLLERFMDTGYDDLTPEEHAAFEALLRNEDPDLYGLLAHTIEPADALQGIILERIGACARMR